MREGIEGWAPGPLPDAAGGEREPTPDSSRKREGNHTPQLLFRKPALFLTPQGSRGVTKFEFFMTFYSLLLGLGVAELMLGFANILRAKVRPQLGLLTPLLGVAIFLQAMATFLDAWLKLQDVALNFRGLAIPTLIGICFFVLGTIATPRDLEDWPNLDDYFYRTRRWTIGLLLAVNILIIGYEIPMVLELYRSGKTATVIRYLITNGALMALVLTALFARPRAVVATALVGTSLFFLYFYGDFAPAMFG